MQLEQPVVTKLVIPAAAGLDTVNVTLEDLELRVGRITITCLDKTWTYYWGGMGQCSIREFFLDCDEYYLAKNLGRDVPSSIFNPDALKATMRKQVIAGRRNRCDGHQLSRAEAREQYDAIEAELIGNIPSQNAWLLAKIFGPEWWHFVPEKTNPDYAHLCHVIKVVQQALAAEPIPLAA